MPDPMNCGRCSQTLPAAVDDRPPVLYCGDCAAHFKQSLWAARQKANGPGFTAVGKFAAADDCPKTFEPNTLNPADVRCGVCGSTRVEESYGFCPFGLGGHMLCHTCRAVLDFVEDTGE